jgi:hypothetical protein
MISVAVTFRPIMDLLPRRESKDSPFVPLIGNKDRYLDPNAITVDDQKSLLIPTDVTGVTAANQSPLPTGNIAATGGTTSTKTIPDYSTPQEQTKVTDQSTPTRPRFRN